MTDALRRESGDAGQHHRPTIAHREPARREPRPLPAGTAAIIASLGTRPADPPRPSTGHVRRLVAQLRASVPSPRRWVRKLWLLSPEQRAARKERRRRNAHSPMSLLVDELLAARVDMTQGELAVANVIAQQQARFGYCTLTLGGLGYHAGVARSTVVRALNKLAGTFIRKTRRRRRDSCRNFSNLVEVVHGGWLRRIKAATARRCQERASVRVSIQQEDRAAPFEWAWQPERTPPTAPAPAPA